MTCSTIIKDCSRCLRESSHTIDCPGEPACPTGRLPGQRGILPNASAGAALTAGAGDRAKPAATSRMGPGRRRSPGISASSTYSITTTPLRAATWARTACTCRFRISLNEQPVVNAVQRPADIPERPKPSHAGSLTNAYDNAGTGGRMRIAHHDELLEHHLQQRRLLQACLPERRFYRALSPPTSPGEIPFTTAGRIL